MLALALASTIMVALGLLDMPYGFYTLLRIVLCLTGAVGFAAARGRHDATWPWVYVVIAVVYNPVMPVHLGDKGLWVGVNLLTLVFVWVGAGRFRHALAGGSGARPA